MDSGLPPLDSWWHIPARAGRSAPTFVWRHDFFMEQGITVHAIIVVVVSVYDGAARSPVVRGVGVGGAYHDVLQ